ncbi:MAG: hypothetical protein AVDCRST_MAG49-2177, partial [uncultured Thermomicrobiales bacterium]
ERATRDPRRLAAADGRRRSRRHPTRRPHRAPSSLSAGFTARRRSASPPDDRLPRTGPRRPRRPRRGPGGGLRPRRARTRRGRGGRAPRGRVPALRPGDRVGPPHHGGAAVPGAPGLPGPRRQGGPLRADRPESGVRATGDRGHARLGGAAGAGPHPDPAGFGPMGEFRRRVQPIGVVSTDLAGGAGPIRPRLGRLDRRRPAHGRRPRGGLVARSERPGRARQLRGDARRDPRQRRHPTPGSQRARGRPGPGQQPRRIRRHRSRPAGGWARGRAGHPRGRADAGGGLLHLAAPRRRDRGRRCAAEGERGRVRHGVDPAGGLAGPVHQCLRRLPETGPCGRLSTERLRRL